MRDDFKLLRETYDSMYMEFLITEGFFDTLKKNFNNILIPAIAVLATGSATAPGFVHKIKDSKAAKSREIAQHRNVTSRNFSNIFSRDDTALSYLKQNSKFTITPRQFMVSKFGERWNNILQNARAQQQNNPSIEFWSNLSDTYLNTPIEVISTDSKEEFKRLSKSSSDTTYGSFNPGTSQVFINLANTPASGITNVMAHEFRHALQNIPSAVSTRGVVQGVQSDMPGGGYVGNPNETGVRIGNLVQAYYNETGRLITNSQEATNALERYGIKLNASPMDIQIYQHIEVSEDVKQLRDLFYKMQQRAPNRAAKFYEILTKQMPGIVYQTYQQSRTTA